MRKFLYLLFLLIPLTVNAACSSADLSRYKTLASNVSYYYDYNGTGFDLTFYNVSSDFRIVNKKGNNSYVSNSNIGDVVVRNLPSGTVDFGVYPISGECSNNRIFTFTVILPFLNKYYNDPVCLNNSSSLCAKWVSVDMNNRFTTEQFKEAAENEKENIEVVEPEKEVHRYGFFDFLADYYIIILLVIIAAGSVGIYFLDKKSKFDFKIS